ncbi:hypothetical protein J1N35_011280, partial [Gossypium stocksii]
NCHPIENKDKDIKGTSEDILKIEHVPPSEHVPLPATSSQVAQLSFDVNIAILDAVHSLSSNVHGLKDEI